MKHVLQKHFMCQNESGESYKNILTPNLYSFIIFDIFNVSFGLDDVHIYAFSRRFYPKRFTEHLGYIYIIFFLYACSLGIEPSTFCTANATLYHWATGTCVQKAFDWLHKMTASESFHQIVVPHVWLSINPEDFLGNRDIMYSRKISIYESKTSFFFFIMVSPHPMFLLLPCKCFM